MLCQGQQRTTPALCIHTSSNMQYTSLFINNAPMNIGQGMSIFAQWMLAGSRTWIGPPGLRLLLSKSEGDKDMMLTTLRLCEFGFKRVLTRKSKIKLMEQGKLWKKLTLMNKKLQRNAWNNQQVGRANHCSGTCTLEQVLKATGTGFMWGGLPSGRMVAILLLLCAA